MTMLVLSSKSKDKKLFDMPPLEVGSRIQILGSSELLRALLKASLRSCELQEERVCSPPVTKLALASKRKESNPCDLPPLEAGICIQILRSSELLRAPVRASLLIP